MRIDIRYLDRTRVEITLTPSWLRRLFGARVRRGVAFRRRHTSWHRGEYQPPAWFWEATEVNVGEAIEQYIECAPVADLPRAALESKS